MELSATDLVLVARHKFGCRTVQRLVETSPPETVRGIVEVILSDFSSVACSPYGNYVVQHLWDHVTDEVRHQLHQAIMLNLRALSEDRFGCAILRRVLSGCAAGDRADLCWALSADASALVSLACSKLGHSVAIQVLDFMESVGPGKSRQFVLQHLRSLETSRFGSKVVSFVTKASGA